MLVLLLQFSFSGTTICQIVVQVLVAAATNAIEL